MIRKQKIDSIGALALIVFSATMGLNQVMIKIVNDGIQPVFQAGLRSILAFFIVYAYARYCRDKINIKDGSLVPGVIAGIFFGFEFILLFLALDYTSVGRASIMFYCMPVWITIAAHFFIPNEKISIIRIIGLLSAFSIDGHNQTSLTDILILFCTEVLGGALLGAGLGFVTFSLMKRIDDYSLEVLLTLGLALGGYQLAIFLHLSGPIMVVVAGLFIGHVGLKRGMSAITRDYINAFWKLIDEMLNAILFLLIGIKVLSIAFSAEVIFIGILTILLCTFARLTSVLLTVSILKPFREFSKGVVPIMTWGGLKGGISIALALSLPENEWNYIILSATYIVVIFSIIIQGLTISKLATYVK